MSIRATLVWVDVAGSAILSTAVTSTGIGAIETALIAKSNADVLSCSEGVLDIRTPSLVNAAYPLINTTAILIFADALGNIATLKLPAPQLGIFMSDNETVDPAQITAIIAAAIGNLLTASGNPVTAFVKGYLQRGKVTLYGNS
jgi:hypothetical protein